MSFECLTQRELSNLVSTFTEQEVLILAQYYTKNLLLKKAEIVQASSSQLKLRVFQTDSGPSTTANIPLHLAVEHPFRLNGIVTLMVTKATIQAALAKGVDSTVRLPAQKVKQTQSKSLHKQSVHCTVYLKYFVGLIVAIAVALAFSTVIQHCVGC